MFFIVFFVSSTQFHKNSQFNEEPCPYLAHLSHRISIAILAMWTGRSFVKYSASLSNTGSMTVVLVAGGRLANITWGVHTGFESAG